MASDQDFVDFVLDQLADELGVTARKMFGEYGLFAGGKMFGMVCDNLLYIKPTEAGRSLIGVPDEAPPYPGARPAFLIGDRIDDPQWLSEVVRATVRELPPPKKRKRKRAD